MFSKDLLNATFIFIIISLLMFYFQSFSLFFCNYLLKIDQNMVLKFFFYRSWKKFIYFLQKYEISFSNIENFFNSY